MFEAAGSKRGGLETGAQSHLNLNDEQIEELRQTAFLKVINLITHS